ncbi:MAG: hypothetical protein C4334_13355 [Pyrinomonas sp.]
MRLFESDRFFVAVCATSGELKDPMIRLTASSFGNELRWILPSIRRDVASVPSPFSRRVRFGSELWGDEATESLVRR